MVIRITYRYSADEETLIELGRTYGVPVVSLTELETIVSSRSMEV
jgi:hypothetical protein